MGPFFSIICEIRFSWADHKESGNNKGNTMEAYAVLETGGKQTLVKVGDKIEIEKLDERKPTSSLSIPTILNSFTPSFFHSSASPKVPVKSSGIS